MVGGYGSLATISSQAVYLSQLKLTQANLSLQNLLLTGSDRALKLNTRSIMDQYMKMLRGSQCKKVSFNDEQAKLYAYKPKLVSHIIYGTTELHYLILKLNYMKSVSDFSEERLKQGILMPTTSIESYLAEIQIKEEVVFNRNRETLNNDVNSL